MLREFHCSCKVDKGIRDIVKNDQVVIIFDDGQPRGLWKLGVVEGVLKSAGGETQCTRANAVQAPLPSRG